MEQARNFRPTLATSRWAYNRGLGQELVRLWGLHWRVKPVWWHLYAWYWYVIIWLGDSKWHEELLQVHLVICVLLFQKCSKGIAIMHSVEQSCWMTIVSLLFLVLLVRWDPWTCMMVYWVIRLYRLQVNIQVLILGYITFEPPIFLLGEQLKNVELSVYYSSYLCYHLKLIVFNPVKSLCRYWCVD